MKNATGVFLLFLYLSTVISCSDAPTPRTSTPSPAVAKSQPTPDDDSVPPETVRLEKVNVFGRVKTVSVSNKDGHYVLNCNLGQSTCLTPTPGKDYWLFSKVTKWTMPGAKDRATLQFFIDFSGSYPKGENIALVPAQEDRTNWGIYWLESWSAKNSE